MRRGFFGNLFDLDHNDELDSREQLLDFMAFEEMSKEEEGDDDDDERREAFEDAGLDSDDYDF